MLIKMEENYKTLRMPELRSIATERNLVGYSRLRKAELIAFLQNNSRVRSAHEQRRSVLPQSEDKEEP